MSDGEISEIVMATIDESILDAAHRDGVLVPENADAVYLQKSARVVCQILCLVGMANSRGATIAAICHHMDIDQNTARIYTRWMEDKGLIEIEREGRSNILRLPDK